MRHVRQVEDGEEDAEALDDAGAQLLVERLPVDRAHIEAVLEHVASDTRTSARLRAIQAAARKAGREPFTVCQIRHSFATWLRHTGAELADIQDLYGHTDAATTRIYAAPTLAKQRDALQRLRLVRSR